MNEVVSHAVNVRVDHERIEEAKNEHNPERGVLVEEEHREEERQVKKAGESGQGVPPRVGKDGRGSGDAFCSDGLGIHLTLVAIMTGGQDVRKSACVLARSDR